MAIKYDGITFKNPSELNAYKALVQKVCGDEKVDMNLEEEILEIEALENDTIGIDNNLDYQFDDRFNEHADLDDNYGELQF